MNSLVLSDDKLRKEMTNNISVDDDHLVFQRLDILMQGATQSGMQGVAAMRFCLYRYDNATLLPRCRRQPGLPCS